MYTISSMRTSDKYQLTEEKLLQSTNLSQANQDKELILSQLVQAQETPRLHLHKFKETVKVKETRPHQLPQHQRK